MPLEPINIKEILNFSYGKSFLQILAFFALLQKKCKKNSKFYVLLQATSRLIALPKVKRKVRATQSNLLPNGKAATS